MPELVYVILRYLFLFLLYVFVLLVAWTVYRELSPVPSAKAAPAPSRRVARKGKASLVFADGEGRRRRIAWEAGGEVLIGRAPECTVCLQDEFASNLHARISQSEGRFFIEDLGSTNGTYVNGRRINYPTELRGGDSIKVGNTTLEFRL